MMALPVTDLSVANQRALAKAITLVERGGLAADAFLAELQSRIGRAHICGVTGPPGAGKSAFVERLALTIRGRKRSVAIVAVDPSSPFTGGAVLGDRLRMAEALGDPSIYMRSLASRGHLGGLSAATSDVISVLDAAGFDFVIVETVGAGQSEVDIMRLAHTTLVVMVPGLGDRVQSDKAGILEIADIFLVNKSDRPGADKVRRELDGMLDLSHMGDAGINRWPAIDMPAVSATSTATPMANRYGAPDPGGMSWRPPVIGTAAISGAGTDQVLDCIEQHHAFLDETGRLQARLLRTINDALRRSIHAAVDKQCFGEVGSARELQSVQDAIASGQLNMHQAVQRMLKRIGDALSGTADPLN
jgi:LAO/AO transport system kinase